MLENKSKTVQIIATSIIGAIILGGGYWLKAQFGISLSKYGHGDGEPQGFEWIPFLLWTLGGAVLGGALMAWSAFRNGRGKD